MNALTANRPQLRVALFSGNYQYIRDGANQALNRWVAFLERRGAAVRVYSPTGPTAAFAHAGTLVSVPSIPIPRRNEYRLALGLPASLKKDLADFRPNIFHLSAPDLLGYGALRLAHELRIPTVASVHTRFETYLRYYGLGWLERYAIGYLRHFYGRCAEIYAPTPEMVNVLRAQRMSENIAIWSRGVDVDLFSPQKRNQAWRRAKGFGAADVVVAFVGRLVLEKGLNVFADTIDAIKAAGINCRVLVVGDGPERGWLERRLPSAVFTGFLSGEELACAYASADIFFNPSLTETFGNVTLEAMASGLPAVCAAATGSISLVRPNITGLLSYDGTARNYADHLGRLICDDNLRRTLGVSARAASLPYVWDSILSSLLSRFQDVVSCGQMLPTDIESFGSESVAVARGHSSS